MESFSEKNYDVASMVENYRNQFKKHGYSPMALGWTKGKQDIRFEVLTSFFNLENKSILDLGCGFGDLNRYIRENITKNFSYTGIDVVPEFISKAIEMKNVDDDSKFLLGDFISTNLDEKFDIVLGSGIFNHKFSKGNNDEFIRNALFKACDYATEGVAFDFLTNRVGYELPHVYYSDPKEVLALGLLKSNNIIFRADYFPFEYAIAVYMDQEFDKHDTTYISWKNNTSSYRGFKKHIFSGITSRIK